MHEEHKPYHRGHTKTSLDNIIAAAGVALFGIAFASTAVGVKLLVWAVYNLN